MADRVTWLDHKGFKIMTVDYSSMKVIEEVKQVIENSEKIHFQQPKKSVRRITLMKDSFFNDEARELLSVHKDKILEYTIASASVGFTGIKAVIAKVINPKMKNFNTVEEAADWLIQQE